jgi:HTH-type transcriptional regulator / antitoxin HigA
MARSQTPTKTRRSVAGSRYLDLVREVPLRPIRSEAELDRAITMIDSLLDQEKRDSDEEDYLDVLSDLVEKYEDDHDPMPPVNGAEMLRFLIESNETIQAKLAIETGIAESTISSLLAGKRELSRRHIEALSRYFHVSPAVFMST